jgi:phosphopantothenoylcysteine decarboxylase/phosphopantothenate--cysteine ligase
MNVRMWQHASTQRNMAQLKADGIRVVEPAEGEMACGEFGPGRLAEPQDILDQLSDLLR